MGHLKRRRHARSRNLADRLSLSLVIFVVTLSIFVLLRISSLVPMVTDAVCDLDTGIFRTESSYQTSTIELFALTAALTIALQLVAGVLSWRAWSLSESLLGGVNIAMGIGLLVYCLVSWSFFHPANPLAQHVNSWSKLAPHYGVPSRWEHNDTWRDYLEDSPRWELISGDEFYNSDLEVTARRELTRKCLSTELMQENFEARFPDTKFDGTWHEIQDWVFYNREGKLLGDHTPRFDWQHKQVIRRLPSPDWRSTKQEYQDLLDYLQAEEDGDLDHP